MSNLSTIDITVRNGMSAYITSTVHGQRASCSHSAAEAANRLGRKLYGAGFQRAELLRGAADHTLTIWRLHGSEERRHERG